MQGKQGGGVAADGRLSFTGWLVCAIAAIGFAVLPVPRAGAVDAQSDTPHVLLKQ